MLPLDSQPINSLKNARLAIKGRTIKKKDIYCFYTDDLITYRFRYFGLRDVDHLHSLCSQVKRHKICIRGNHDRNASYMMRVGFLAVLESAFLKISPHTLELIHIPANQKPTHFQLRDHVHEKRPSKIMDLLDLIMELQFFLLLNMLETH